MHHPVVLTPTAKKKPGGGKGHNPTPPQWPSFKGSSHFVGVSPSGKVTVFVDPTLGAEGLRNAQDLVSDGDRVVHANDTIFGTTGGPTKVIVFALGGQTDGTGGADHMGCDYTSGENIEVCAAFGNSARVSALFEAELSECSMGGQLCGHSNGEALSRWCAAAISNNALSDFATAPTWVGDGMPDFVNKTDPTDQSADSTGCGMAFISWLMSKGHSLASIAQGMVALGDGGTLAALFARLTSSPAAAAWPQFEAAIKALPNGVTDDDPFGAGHLAHLTNVNALTADLAGQVFSAVMSGILAGKSAQEMVASVQAIVGTSTPTAAAAAACAPGSRRLMPPA